MNIDHTTTIASVERFLKIERINRFLRDGRVTLTFSHGGIDFPITAIDANGHVVGATESADYRIELSTIQLEDIYTFVVEEEKSG